MADYWSADNRRLTISRLSADWRLIQKNLFCCFISAIYLGSDCYPRTLTYLKDYRLQIKQKRIQEQRCQTLPVLSETEATLMFQQMTYIDAYINFILVTCSPYNAITTIGDTYEPIGRYRLSANYRCIVQVASHYM